MWGVIVFQLIIGDKSHENNYLKRKNIMKLSELLNIKNAIESAWELNDSLPGPFEHASRRIMGIIGVEVKGLQESAQEIAKKGGKKDEEPDPEQVQKELDGLIKEFWDEDVPVKLPRIKEEWLPEKVAKGTSVALEPIMNKISIPEKSAIEKLISARENKGKKK